MNYTALGIQLLIKKVSDKSIRFTRHDDLHLCDYVKNAHATNKIFAKMFTVDIGSDKKSWANAHYYDVAPNTYKSYDFLNDYTLEDIRDYLYVLVPMLYSPRYQNGLVTRELAELDLAIKYVEKQLHRRRFSKLQDNNE